MNEDKATRYHRLRRRAGGLSVALSASVLALLVATGGAVLLRDFAAELALRAGAIGSAHSRLVVAVFVLLVAGFLQAVTLPVAFYRGFVLDRRYGLSAESAPGWLRGHLGAAAIALLLAQAGALAVYELLHAWPGWWWLAAAAGFALAVVALANLAPLILFPLFFSLRPLRRPALHARLVSLASRAGARVLGVFEWGVGSRTRRANAALVGLAGTRRILLSDTLLAEYSDDEIEVICAHELAHHVHGDLWKAIGLEAAILVAAFFSAHVAAGAAAPALGLEGRADVAGLPVLLLAGGAVSVALTPVRHLLSRRHERRADRYALDLTGNAAAFVSAMRRLAAQNLAELEPGRLVEALYHSHPSIAERIATARQWQAGRREDGPVCA